MADRQNGSAEQADTPAEPTPPLAVSVIVPLRVEVSISFVAAPLQFRQGIAHVALSACNEPSAGLS